MAEYLQPERPDDALAALGKKPWLVLAGGTDVAPARVDRPLEEDIC